MPKEPRWPESQPSSKLLPLEQPDCWNCGHGAQHPPPRPATGCSCCCQNEFSTIHCFLVSFSPKSQMGASNWLSLVFTPRVGGQEKQATKNTLASEVGGEALPSIKPYGVGFPRHRKEVLMLAAISRSQGKAQRDDRAQTAVTTLATEHSKPQLDNKDSTHHIMGEGIRDYVRKAPGEPVYKTYVVSPCTLML